MTATSATPVIIDAFGLTDIGKVRKDNEDHFVVGTNERRCDDLAGGVHLAVCPSRHSRRRGLSLGKRTRALAGRRLIRAKRRARM